MNKVRLFVFIFFEFSRINQVKSIYTDLAKVITQFGYPVETHHIQTEDGYILTTYRIPYGVDNKNPIRRPVLITHGLLTTAGDFIILSPEKSLGYILADNGYDVWLMNCRGNTYSKRHISIKESNRKSFYNFSYHEIGMYDIPANVDYILKVTNQSKLHYIGHSQGGATFLIMTSTRPEYNRKIRHASLLAPAAFLWNVRPFYAFLGSIGQTIDNIRQFMELYNIPFVGTIRTSVHWICSNPRLSAVCFGLVDLYAGYIDYPQADLRYYAEATKVTPSDGSIKQIVHFCQSISTGKFQMFDYGPEGNLKQYSQKTPPDYNLKNIDAPVTSYVAENDQFVSIDACKRTMRDIKSGTLKVVPYKLFNHADFIYAIDVIPLLYEDLLKTMALY